MSALIDYNTDTEHLLLMEKKLRELNLNNDQKVFLHFAIGKAYEDQKNFSEAAKHIENGNLLKFSSTHNNLDRERKLPLVNMEWNGHLLHLPSIILINREGMAISSICLNGECVAL